MKKEIITFQWLTFMINVPAVTALYNEPGHDITYSPSLDLLPGGLSIL
jgi:hypothetical protein